MTSINWTEALDGATHVLESGRDFETGTDFAVMQAARREAALLERDLKLGWYQRMSEVEPGNRDALDGRRFPVIVIQAAVRSAKNEYNGGCGHYVDPATL